MTPLIQSWLLQSAIIFLIIGSIAGMVVGALLLFSRARLHRISKLLDRWISSRHLDRSLEKKISLDPWFYRHRRLTGTLILCGSLFILYFFTLGIDRAQTVAGLARRLAYPSELAAGLLDALVLSALLGALGALLVSLFLLFRPSQLRGFEQHANQWISLRKSLKPWELPRDEMELYVDRHARQVGIFLMLGGLYTLVMLLYWAAR